MMSNKDWSNARGKPWILRDLYLEFMIRYCVARLVVVWQVKQRWGRDAV